jgi:hypothetical protein
MRDALLLQQEMAKPLCPMLLRDDVRAPAQSPSAIGSIRCTRKLWQIASLARVGEVPILMVTRFPAPVWDNHHLDDLIGDRLDARIDLAAFGQEVVFGIDKEKRSSVAWVADLGHGRFLLIGRMVLAFDAPHCSSRVTIKKQNRLNRLP